jgi:hypothetical protein
MKELMDLIERLRQERPAAWEKLPDIELYKDQVLSYMKRQHTLQTEDAELTGAMINNYIKSGLLPRTSGKKYVREHLAYLTSICTLKQVLSVGEVDFLLKKQPDIHDSRHFYDEYWKQLDEALSETSNMLDKDIPEDQLAVAAMRLAAGSYAQKLACEKILEIIREKEKPAESRKK